MALLVGQLLGEYFLLEHIGRGGFADVYRGEHRSLKREAAIKVFTAQMSDKEKQNFLQEAQIVARMNHRHIIKILDYREVDDMLFLIMDYAPNGTLRQLPGKTLPLTKVVSYVNQVADALLYVHKQNIIHRDVKPDNMLLNANDEVLLSDFGIAVDSVQQHNTAPRGTIYYVAPEQLRRAPTAASDQYALAVVVYEWLCGRCPFSGFSDQIIHIQHLNMPPPSLRQFVPTIPIAVEEVVLRALAKKPQDRFPDVMAFAAALEQASQLPQPQPAAQPQNNTSAPPAQQPVAKPSPPAQTSGGLASTVRIKQAQNAAPPTTPVDATQPAMPFVVPAASFYQYTGHTSDVNAVQWSPDGKRIASAACDKTVHVWDAADGGNVLVYKSHTHIVWSVIWSPDSTRIASAADDQIAHIWQATTGNKLFTYQYAPGKANDFLHGTGYTMAWSPDGRAIVSASDEQIPLVWDASNGKPLFMYHEHSASVQSLAWSPDSTRIVSGSRDHGVHIWHAYTGEQDYIFRQHRSTLRAVAWSHNGKRIASASHDGIIYLWNAHDGGNLLEYRQHAPRKVSAVAWSPDDTRVASASHTTISVWDVSTGKQVSMYRDHTDTVNALSWSPNGAHLASASDDATVRIWKVS